jgi:hypothetical protein
MRHAGFTPFLGPFTPSWRCLPRFCCIAFLYLLHCSQEDGNYGKRYFLGSRSHHRGLSEQVLFEMRWQ